MRPGPRQACVACALQRAGAGAARGFLAAVPPCVAWCCKCWCKCCCAACAMASTRACSCARGDSPCMALGTCDQIGHCFLCQGRGAAQSPRQQPRSEPPTVTMALSLRTPLRVNRQSAVVARRPARVSVVKTKALLETSVVIGGSTVAFLTLVSDPTLTLALARLEHIATRHQGRRRCSSVFTHEWDEYRYRRGSTNTWCTRCHAWPAPSAHWGSTAAVLTTEAGEDVAAPLGRSSAGRGSSPAQSHVKGTSDGARRALVPEVEPCVACVHQSARACASDDDGLERLAVPPLHVGRPLVTNPAPRGSAQAGLLTQ